MQWLINSGFLAAFVLVGYWIIARAYRGQARDASTQVIKRTTSRREVRTFFLIYNNKKSIPPIIESSDEYAFTNEKRLALKSALEQIKVKYHVPGLIVTLRHFSSPKRSTLVGNFFLGSTTIPELSPNVANVPMNESLHFRIGSVTKSMMATLIVILYEKGYLTLQSKIDQWFPDFPNAEKITVLQLLNMTSGLGDFENTARFEGIFRMDPEIHWDVRDCARWGRDEPVHFEPGTAWAYCNTGYILLGLIAEHLLNENNTREEGYMSLSAAFKKFLFDPLEMTSTYLPYCDSTITNPHPQGYSEHLDGKLKDATDWSCLWAWAAGGVISTSEDLHKWASNIGNGILLKAHRMPMNKFLESEMPTLLNEASIKANPKFDRYDFFYGLGVIYDHEWVWHNANTFGFQCACAYYPPLNLSVIISVNQNTLKADEIRYKLPTTDAIMKEVSKIYTPQSVVFS
jgi:D-alanyl-D-alanine carboxypeptidase